MKSIVMAGGRGTRLDPLTRICSKHLLPCYDQPIICYPLHTLRTCGLKPEDTAIITTPESMVSYRLLLGEAYTYIAQPHPGGIAQGPVLAKDWLAGEPFLLILGDNLFVNFKAPATLALSVKEVFVEEAGRWSLQPSHAHIFTTSTQHPERYGCWDGQHLIEKPVPDPTWLAIPGLYHLPGDAPGLAEMLAPSPNGELEILDLLRVYQQLNRLMTWPLDCLWLDLGTFDDLLTGAQLIQFMRAHQGSKIGIL